ncbi:hypothetical protein C4A77_06015 [Brevibacillus laterosporus]|uniref:Integrase catalytic domain-containing protein n=1 Tax=Brevibacillus laterosporus TaxID=1465 RepID=A0AAP8QEW6_BRELA|nr:hypothetical protein C4A77_06015 [Brevibacillus laterosporus]
MQINHKRVQRIMREEGLQCRVKVKKRKRIGQPIQVADHLLKRDFQANHPLQKLVTDITYLPYGGKMLYLSSIMDLYNGEIIAYNIGDTQDTTLVLDTLQQLPPLEQCMLHSDQGSVYTSSAYQLAVKERGITMSMSRKGTPADNAPIESFHACLKSETFILEELTCTTTAIVEQMIVFNRKYILDSDVIEFLNNSKTLRCDTINGYVSLMLQRKGKYKGKYKITLDGESPTDFYGDTGIITGTILKGLKDGWYIV